MRLLTTPGELEDGLRELRGASSYFVDTEFESSRQGKRLSLIQISRGDEIYLIDALRLSDLTPLGEAIGHPEQQWVLHAGLQDVELLVEAFRCNEPPRLLDTQVAWALLGPEAGVSLAFLQFKLLGLRTSKGHQADDWMRRPLPDAQLAYAAQDVAHLPALEAELRTRARRLGREDALHEASRDFLLPVPAPALPLTFESFRNAWQLDSVGQAALRLLIDWHNALPSDAPSLASRTLLSIAGRLPESTNDLSRIKGVSSHVCRKHGAALVARMQQARQSAGEAPDLEPPAYGNFEDFVREAQLMLVRAEACAACSVAPEVGLPMSIVKRMHHRVKSAGRLDAATSELSGWRQRLLGEAMAQRIKPFAS